MYGLSAITDILSLKFSNPKYNYLPYIFYRWLTTTIPIFSSPLFFAYVGCKGTKALLKTILPFPVDAYC
jgi:hypothetical protein